MLTPLSWLRQFVDIDITVEELAERLTLAGLEVAHLRYLGLPQNHFNNIHQPPSDHLVWSREKILLGSIRKIEKHPNADLLVIAIVDIGRAEPVRCVTGAPNLFEYAGHNPFSETLWVAWADEGAELWDGHSEKPRRMTLKGRNLRGIYNNSMVCSERELGISSEHEGILLIENTGNYSAGQPLADVLGDVLLDIELTPNLARCYSILGVAREVAALLDRPVREPQYQALMEGGPIDEQIGLEIRQPALNPRFTFSLLRDSIVRPSPWWLQWRLKLVGQRPINNIVDITNYITLEIGQPLHAYDYDSLVERAKGHIPQIHTRTASVGEKLRTLDQVERELGEECVLVSDEAGALGLGGVIGGASTAIHAGTRNVLLEAANWDYINIRQTMKEQKLNTEAGARFGRGVHPEIAPHGLLRGIELMRQTGGGQIADGFLDEYPLSPSLIRLKLPVSDVERLLGIHLAPEEIATLLRRLQFEVEIGEDGILRVVVPPHRLDINEDPMTGRADLVEEIARVYGYDRLPLTNLADSLPEQWANETLQWEERIRDFLVQYGLQENIGYRLTSPEREKKLFFASMPPAINPKKYVRITNPIATDKTVLRQSLLGGLLTQLSENLRWHDTQQVFEIGPVFYARSEPGLPEEEKRLAILLCGAPPQNDWLAAESAEPMDFYDIKGLVHALLKDLHIPNWDERRSQQSSYHPGRAVDICLNGKICGSYGELHPLVAEEFGLGERRVLVAEFRLCIIESSASVNFAIKPISTTPPILQDIALVLPEQVTHEETAQVITRAAGKILRKIHCFDVYSGPPIPSGYKSLAFSLTYQTDDRTLTDKEVARVQQRIVRATKRELGAELRQ